MKLSYEDLISGDSIYVKNVGHIHSPKLKELKPSGIGMWTYHFYLNILLWEKEDIIKFISTIKIRNLDRITQNKNFGVFDTITLIDYTRELLQNALAFFIDEALTWDAKNFKFILKNKADNNDTGYIDRENYDEIRDMVLQLNYINVGDAAKPTKYSSKKAQELWEKAQKYIKENAKNQTQDAKMALGNIISKLCASSTTYNLLNIYDLTVFQLYDQFFQFGYLRAMELNETIYAIHGGKDFNVQAWLKPILKN